jgi:hypothetical protein
MSISFDPLIPASLWMALAAMSAALLGWYALRRPGALTARRWSAVIALMAVAIVLVLAILLNPTLVRELPAPPGKPLLTVLIDTSASMATTDSADRRTRYEVACETAKRLADRLSDQFDVRVRSFSDAVTAADPAQLASRPPMGKLTDIATGIVGALEQDRPQGQAIVLLSDGIDNAGGGSGRVLDAVRSARALSAPLYTKTLGGESHGIDVSLALRAPQDLAFVGQRVPLTVTVRQIGVPSAKTEVMLLRDGKEIARREVTLRGATPSDVYFMVSQDHVGLYPYEVRVSSLPQELTLANNHAPYLLRVVDEPIRVLLLEGKPYWDSKFLVRTLTADPAVALDSIVRVADKRLMRRTLSGRRETGASASADASSAPLAPATQPRVETWKVMPDVSDLLASPEQLRGYQILVLGRDAEVFLGEQAINTLQNWVAQDGGSVVCYRGSPTSQVNQRLGRMLPVSWEPAGETRFRVKLTEQGRDLHWWRGATGGDGDASSDNADVLGALPALASRTMVGQSKPLAVVLATGVASASGTSSGGNGQDSPAVVYQPYGTGRVVVIEGAGMWRWAFLPPAYQKQEEIYAALWQSLLRWLTSGANLVPGQNIALRADKVSYSTSEAATATLLVRDEKGGSGRDNVRVELTGGSDDSSPKSFTPVPMGDEPGTFRINFGNLPVGRYKARIAGASPQNASSLAVFEVGDLGDEQLDLTARPDLMKRIAADSGGADLTSDDLAGAVQKNFTQYMKQAHPPQVERLSAWDRWWILVVVLLAWTASWAVRRSGGLV